MLKNLIRGILENSELVMTPGREANNFGGRWENVSPLKNGLSLLFPDSYSNKINKLFDQIRVEYLEATLSPKNNSRCWSSQAEYNTAMSGNPSGEKNAFSLQKFVFLEKGHEVGFLVIDPKEPVWSKAKKIYRDSNHHLNIVDSGGFFNKPAFSLEAYAQQNPSVITKKNEIFIERYGSSTSQFCAASRSFVQGFVSGFITPALINEVIIWLHDRGYIKQKNSVLVPMITYYVLYMIANTVVHFSGYNFFNAENLVDSIVAASWQTLFMGTVDLGYFLSKPFLPQNSYITQATQSLSQASLLMSVSAKDGLMQALCNGIGFSLSRYLNHCSIRTLSNHYNLYRNLSPKQELIKNARMLALASETPPESSIFTTLPAELLVKICAHTVDDSNLPQDEREAIIYQNFARPETLPV